MIRTKSQVPGAACLYIQFAGSAALEEPEYRGLSHLWEHMQCKTWQPAQDVFSKWAIDWNAFTSADRIAFYMRGLDEGVSEIAANHVLGTTKHNMLTFVPTREDFEKERNVVVQEYDSCFSDRGDALQENICRRALGVYNPIGERKVLTELTFEKYMKFTERYRNPAIVHYVGTNGTPSLVVPETQDTADYLSGEIRYALCSGTSDYNLPLECSSFSGTETIIGDYVVLRNYAAPLRQFLTMLWSAGFDAPIMTEIRHKRGLAYTARLRCYNPLPLVMFYITTGPESVAECRSVIKQVLGNVEDYITPKRFAAVQEMAINSLRLTNLNNVDVNHLMQKYDSSALTGQLIRGYDYEKCLALLRTWGGMLHTAHIGSELIVE